MAWFTSIYEVTLLGVSIDSNLTFKNHINELNKKASHKLQDFFYQNKKPDYFPMLLLTVSFYMLL